MVAGCVLGRRGPAPCCWCRNRHRAGCCPCSDRCGSPGSSAAARPARHCWRPALARADRHWRRSSRFSQAARARRAASGAAARGRGAFHHVNHFASAASRRQGLFCECFATATRGSTKRRGVSYSSGTLWGWRQGKRVQRVRIGLTGLAFVFLLVLLGAVFTSPSNEAPITPNLIETQLSGGNQAVAARRQPGRAQGAARRARRRPRQCRRRQHAPSRRRPGALSLRSEGGPGPGEPGRRPRCCILPAAAPLSACPGRRPARRAAALAPVMLMTGLPLVWGETGPFDPGSRPAAAYVELSRNSTSGRSTCSTPATLGAGGCCSSPSRSGSRRRSWPRSTPGSGAAGGR